MLTEKQIVESEAFRTINLLVDEKAAALQQAMRALLGRAGRLRDEENASGVLVRTSLEETLTGAARGVALPFSPKDAADLRGLLDEIVALDASINELMRLKLRLLNDYDFTHGDAKDQKRVFRDPSV